ncbi:phytanoyl-CoA dioxygenase family protein [Streptomyces sp. CA2R101]|uniref:phytanoyl-CoA dioxygenase family protein n=1 Tax=Streptomyces sp. CA2R101 TaxID=3120152 RepID=UPI00300B22CC
MEEAAGPSPKGFTRETWEMFARDGILVIENALTATEVETLVAAVEKQRNPTSWNIVETDVRFTPLIDLPAHIGYVYDVYGEMLKLLRSEFFKREPQQPIRNRWHFDGPRVLPFEVFSPKVPLRIKVGYWLTPLTTENRGNLVYIPGSHHWAHLPQYHTHEPHPQERQLTIGPGAMTLMWSGIWHRVAENNGEDTRLNLFLEYGPSWIVSSDRVSSDPEWMSGLSRTRRILMRDYEHPNNLVKLPEGDVPLYLPRPGELDPEAELYTDNVPPALRKRSTWLEREELV